MRKRVLLFGCVFVLALPHMALASIAWQDLGSVLSKAEKAEHPIFVDFYADWCGPCKQMDKETFTDAKVMEASNKFYMAKVNVDVDEGPKLREKYRVFHYPTILFLSAKGEELDRMVGFVPAQDLLTQMDLIASGKNPFTELTQKAEQAEEKMEHLELFFQAGSKYAERGDVINAQTYLNRILKLDPENQKGFSDQALLALGDVAMGTKAYDASLGYFSDLIQKFPQSKHIESAFVLSAKVYEKQGNVDKSVATYKSYVAKFPNQANAYNSFAWFCATKKIALDEALLAAQKAVELDSSAGIIDTLAETYYAMGRFDDAIAAIDRAIALDPSDQYYKDQRQKFEKAKLESAPK